MPFFVNRAGLQMVGLDTFEQATHTPVAEFFFPEDQARIINEFFPQVFRDTQGEIDTRFRHFKTSAARWMAYKVPTLTDAPSNLNSPNLADAAGGPSRAAPPAR